MLFYIGKMQRHPQAGFKGRDRVEEKAASRDRQASG